eukprot:jgi/Bigna1/83729/fgenesh1_pg.114_\
MALDTTTTNQMQFFGSCGLKHVRIEKMANAGHATNARDLERWARTPNQAGSDTGRAHCPSRKVFISLKMGGEMMGKALCTRFLLNGKNQLQPLLQKMKNLLLSKTGIFWSINDLGPKRSSRLLSLLPFFSASSRVCSHRWFRSLPVHHSVFWTGSSSTIRRSTNFPSCLPRVVRWFTSAKVAGIGWGSENVRCLTPFVGWGGNTCSATVAQMNCLHWTVTQGTLACANEKLRVIEADMNAPHRLCALWDGEMPGGAHGTQEVHGTETPHPDVATRCNNIGAVHERMGKHPEALTEHKKSLNVRLKVHGTEKPHPDVAHGCGRLPSYASIEHI